MKGKITIVQIWDDWEACYLDGKLIQEGHTIRVDYLLKSLGYEVEGKEVKYEKDDDPIDVPKNLGDIKNLK